MARVLHACLLLVVATSADDEWSSHTKCAPPAVTWSRVDARDSAARFVPEIAALGHALVSLEHVNLNLPAGAEPNATAFYVGALGFAPDPRAAAVCARTRAAGGGMASLHWMNIGLQQLHLPVEPPAPQRVRGSLGLEFADLDALAARLRAARVPARWRGGGEGEEERWLELACPVTGTDIRAHAPPRARGGGWLGPAPRLDERCGAHAAARPPGGASLGLGLRDVEFVVPRRPRGGGAATAARVCAFYEAYFGARATVADGGARCAVAVGLHQALVFRDAVGSEEVGEYDGHHIAVYVNGFAAAYERLARAGLVWDNPRFPHLTYPNLSAALGHAEFRVRTIADPETGEALYELEHEVRSLEHATFSGRAWLGEPPPAEAATCDDATPGRGASPGG